MDIDKYILNCDTPKENYLRKAKENSDGYYSEFKTAISNLENVLSEREILQILNEKMLLNKKVFNEKTFIQGACEVAVANYFSEKADFKMEEKVNPENQKDVDCQFKSNGFTYNIEIKCASFDAKEAVEQSDAFKIQTLGRIDNRDEAYKIIQDAIDDGLKNQGKPLKEHKEIKNMDNNLKDFLLSAHEKFNSNCSDKEINVLLIGCNDPADIQSWTGYLVSSGGLFTQNSFHDVTTFNNVDIVVFTNLYFKHKDFDSKNIQGSWSLDKTLNLFMENPFRLQEKQAGLENFGKELANYNNEINAFEVAGDVPIEVKNSVKVPHFVIDYLEKGNNTYLFENKE